MCRPTVEALLPPRTRVSVASCVSLCPFGQEQPFLPQVLVPPVPSLLPAVVQTLSDLSRGATHVHTETVVTIEFAHMKQIPARACVSRRAPVHAFIMDAFMQALDTRVQNPS